MVVDPDAFGYGLDTFMIRFGYGKILIDAFIYMSLRIITDVSSCRSFYSFQILDVESTGPVDTRRTDTFTDKIQTRGPMVL